MGGGGWGWGRRTRTLWSCSISLVPDAFYRAVNPLPSQLPSCFSKTMLTLPLALYNPFIWGPQFHLWSDHSSPLTKHSLASLFLEACICSSLSTSCLPHLHPLLGPLLSRHPRPSLLYLDRMWLGSILEPCSSPFTLPGKHHWHGTPIAQDGATAAPPAPPLTEAGPT